MAPIAFSESALCSTARISALLQRFLLLLGASAAFITQKPSAFAPRCVSCNLSAQSNVITVALTREAGNNDKFRDALLRHFESKESSLADTSRIRIMELPCIAHANGPDFDKLQVILKETNWDYVTVTSPEAARVLASAWPWIDQRQQPELQTAVTTAPPAVVAVGKATEKALEEAQIAVCFCPSKATAQVLVQELPAVQRKNGSSTGTPQKVLYPASAQAKPTLQSGLEARGFCVTRLDTYDTVTAVWGEQEQQIAAQTVIACFASPSAVKGWLQNSNNNISVRAACIGETSANECREQGWPEESIFYPEKPGLEGWVQAVVGAAKSVRS